MKIQETLDLYIRRYQNFKRHIYTKEDRNGAQDGDVVVVKITKYPAERRKPEGVVTEIQVKKVTKELIF